MSHAYTIQSKIRGYHVYGKHWTTVLGEQLASEREIGNMVDRYAVAVKKDGGETVGHGRGNFPEYAALFYNWVFKLQLQ